MVSRDAIAFLAHLLRGAVNEQAARISKVCRLHTMRDDKHRVKHRTEAGQAHVRNVTRLQAPPSDPHIGSVGTTRTSKRESKRVVVQRDRSEINALQ